MGEGNEKEKEVEMTGEWKSRTKGRRIMQQKEEERTGKR